MNPVTSKSLTVLLWNSNGLARRRNELDLLLHEKRIDVALITETHFTDKTRLYIRDYKLYRTDHPDNAAQGGSAIFIRNSIAHFPIPSQSTDSLQATSISLVIPVFPNNFIFLLLASK